MLLPVNIKSTKFRKTFLLNKKKNLKQNFLIPLLSAEEREREREGD